MAALNTARLNHWLVWTLHQNLRSVLRHWNVVAVAVSLIALTVSVVGFWQLSQRQQQLGAQAQALAVSRLNAATLPAVTDAAQELVDFQKQLPLHEDIPVSLRELITLAQTHQLALARGEYKSQADVNGQFFRYDMTFPVQGNAQAIERFVLAALAQHSTLALESVQFKRERIESKEVEAKIQWTLFTQLPPARSKP